MGIRAGNKTDKELDSLNPFYNEVVLPELAELLDKKEATLNIFKEFFTEKQLRSIAKISIALDHYLGESNIFMKMLIQILVAKKHADKNDFLSDPVVVIAYAVYSATEEWYIDPAFGKHRLKKARATHDKIQKTGISE